MSLPVYALYQDTNIKGLGRLPSHWKVSRLGYEAWVRARLGWKGLKAEEYVEDGFAFLSTPNIKGREIDFYNVNFITQTRYDESPEIKLAKNDVLLAKDGSTLGTVNVVRHLPRAATVNSSIAVITAKDKLNGVFLYYLFQSEFLQNTIQMLKGGMGVPHLFQEDLNRVSVPLPPIIEQIGIGLFLDRETAKIDELVAEQEKLIVLLADKRQSTISYAITKGLNPDTLMKDSGIDWMGKMPAHWGVSALSYLGSIETGSTPDRSKPSYWNGSIPWLKTGEINWTPIREAEEFITEAGLENSAAKVARPGTLLMAMYGQGVTRGRVAILEIEAAYNQACAAILFGRRITPQFGRYFFMAAYHHIREAGNETSQMNLSAGLIAKIRLPVPPVCEQESAVRFLDSELKKLDTLILESERVIILLKERRAALISAAVTGQIDVRSAISQTASEIPEPIAA
jgi:type I restriction enzyme S subunit